MVDTAFKKFAIGAGTVRYVVVLLILGVLAVLIPGQADRIVIALIVIASGYRRQSVTGS